MIARRVKYLWVGVGFVTILAFCTGCDGSAPRESRAAIAKAPASTASIGSIASAAPPPVAAAIVPAPKTTAAAAAPRQRQVGESSLKLNRFVVTTGVKDREPLASSEALVADGSAVYAFVELANPVGDSENVRITFERKGGAERVADVTLPVPGGVPRYRTWAFTHFIRAAGVWEAVLYRESGTELGRISFEVKQPSASTGA